MKHKSASQFLSPLAPDSDATLRPDRAFSVWLCGALLASLSILNLDATPQAENEAVEVDEVNL